jgi:DNA repair protein RecO (recombination protein O)
MLSWREECDLLAARRHGETDAIVDLFAPSRGRWVAVVKGGAGRRLRPSLQPGARLSVEWRARLEEHVGTARVEPLRGRAGALMSDADALSALSAAAALLVAALPEREPHPALHARTAALFDALGREGWPAAYARWELSLLAELGYALDLSVCAATGATGRLVWVSPKSGRAVSAEAGAPYAERLLPLPPFLTGAAPPGREDVAAALRLTGFFLTAALRESGREGLPPARLRLAERLGA